MFYANCEFVNYNIYIVIMGKKKMILFPQRGWMTGLPVHSHRNSFISILRTIFFMVEVTRVRYSSHVARTIS